MAANVVGQAIGGEPPAIDPRRDALLLDIDGTLLDIVPHHDAVTVPETLRDDLTKLKDCFGGALALVSGRSLATIDRLFSPALFSAIGCHGAQMRLDPNIEQGETRSPPISDAIRNQLIALNAVFPGVVAEDKAYSIALHYRAAPTISEELVAAAQSICADEKETVLGILHGKFAIEIKPVGIGKGHAVTELLSAPTFAGRRPVFLGDDVTDEAVFAILGGFKGAGISVGRKMAGANYMFKAPRAVREWLHTLTELSACRP